jgi:hypothetical protein
VVRMEAMASLFESVESWNTTLHHLIRSRPTATGLRGTADGGLWQTGKGVDS